MNFLTLTFILYMNTSDNIDGQSAGISRNVRGGRLKKWNRTLLHNT